MSSYLRARTWRPSNATLILGIVGSLVVGAVLALVGVDFAPDPAPVPTSPPSVGSPATPSSWRTIYGQ